MRETGSEVTLHDDLYMDGYDDMSYRDSLTGAYKSHIAVVPNRLYLACWVTDSNTHLRLVPMTDYELGKCYQDGFGDFLKNLQQAIELYEKDQAADSLYAIAKIFIFEPGYENATVAQRYLELASDAGSAEATVHLALLKLLNEEALGRDAVVSRLARTAENGYPPALFLLAYYKERIQTPSDYTSAHDLYSRCANSPHFYRTTRLRLSKEWYTASAQKAGGGPSAIANDYRSDVADFCLGSALLGTGHGILYDARTRISR